MNDLGSDITRAGCYAITFFVVLLLMLGTALFLIVRNVVA